MVDALCVVGKLFEAAGLTPTASTKPTAAYQPRGGSDGIRTRAGFNPDSD